MKKLSFVLPALFFLALTGAAIPAKADHIGISIGGPGYYGGYGGWHEHYYYPGYYPGWGYPGYYVAPPPVVYATPPVTYVEPAPVVVSPSLAASQTSPTYIDNQGRTCRQFESGPGYTGKACLQPDGTWRVVP